MAADPADPVEGASDHSIQSVANGNETVPTVMIGSHALVNPTAKQVKRAIAERAPHLL